VRRRIPVFALALAGSPALASPSLTLADVIKAYNQTDPKILDSIADVTGAVSVSDSNRALEPAVSYSYAQFRELTAGCKAGEAWGDLSLSCPSKKTTDPCFYDAYQVKLGLSDRVKLIRAYKARAFAGGNCAAPPPVVASKPERGN
jgi:hypothetical protein